MIVTREITTTHNWSGEGGLLQFIVFYILPILLPSTLFNGVYGLTVEKNFRYDRIQNPYIRVLKCILGSAVSTSIVFTMNMVMERLSGMKDVNIMYYTHHLVVANAFYFLMLRLIFHYKYYNN